MPLRAQACLVRALSTTALVLCMPSALQAQDLIPETPAEASDDGIIIVTANKREQNLQDVSSAISAVSSEALADTQINSLEDLQVSVPTLKVGNDFAFAKLFIRGVGLNSSLPGLDPSVALHVDGAVVAQPTQQFASLYDLERVEVLRGPQGTLYGRNATGGSVNLITAKPTDYLDGFARLTVGGDDLNITTEGAISGPIIDGIQARVAFMSQNRDGFGTYTRTGEDIDNANKIGVRGQVNVDIASGISNLVAVEYFKEDERSKAVKYLAPSFSAETIAALRANPNLDPRLAAQINNLVSLAGPDAPIRSRDIGGDVVPVGDLETFSVTNTFDADLTNLFSFRSITNYRNGTSSLLQDFDVSNLRNGVDNTNPSTVQSQVVDNEQFSQELQFLVNGSRLRGLVGAYYFQDTISSEILIGIDPLAVRSRVSDLRGVANGADLRALFPQSRVLVLGDMDVEAYALFSNFTFDVTDRFRAKVGARYSHEKRDVTVVTRLPGPGITLPTGADSRSFSDFTPEVGVEFDVGESLLYATYSEGFKSGTAGLADASPFLINPETITNYEVGIKGSYFDGAVNLALAAFSYKISDAQFDRTRLTSVGSRFDTSVENAAETKGRGVELEGTWFVTDAFTLDFNGTYYDITFDNFLTTNPIDPLGALQGLAGLPARLIDLSGNRTRNTPEYTLGARASYETDLANGAELKASVAYSFTGDQFFTEFNDERLSADSYGILDANLKYTFPNDNLSVNFWGKNLTDEFVVSGAYAIATSRTITGTYLPPRQYGVSVQYDF